MVSYTHSTQPSLTTPDARKSLYIKVISNSKLNHGPPSSAKKKPDKITLNQHNHSDLPQKEIQQQNKKKLNSRTPKMNPVEKNSPDKKRKTTAILPTPSFKKVDFQGLRSILATLRKLFLCLKSTHLVVILRRRVKFANSSNFVRRETRDTDVPIAFKNDLDILDVERIGAAELGHLASSGNNSINEFIDDLKHRL